MTNTNIFSDIEGLRVKVAPLIVAPALTNEKHYKCKQELTTKNATFALSPSYVM